MKLPKGLRAYYYEASVLLRLIRAKGSFTETEFDGWFDHRRARARKLSGHGISGDTYILGMGANGGNEWALYLDLLQHLIKLGIVDATTVDGKVVYKRAVVYGSK